MQQQYWFYISWQNEIVLIKTIAYGTSEIFQ